MKGQVACSKSWTQLLNFQNPDLLPSSHLGGTGRWYRSVDLSSLAFIPSFLHREHIAGLTHTMAPGPTATANRPLARPSKVRYFKGKPLDEAVSDESSGEEEPQPQQRIKRVAPPVQDENVVAGGAGRVIRQGGAVGMKMDLGGVKLGGVKPPVKGEIEA